MLTTLGFQIVFFSLCAVIIALALGNIVRRKRREKLLAQRPNEHLDRLEHLERDLHNLMREQVQADLQTGVTPSATLGTTSNTAESVPATSDLVPHSLSEPASVVITPAPNGIPIYRPAVQYGTSWQDRTLFETTSQSNWRGSAAIPRLEPHEVPNVDTSDYTYGAATPILASFLPQNEEASRTIARELIQAGDYAPHARENFAATRFLFMMGSLLLGGVSVLLAPQSAERPLLIGTVAMTSLGWALPALLVRGRAKSRRQDVERAIPDMMDMLNMCVSQGLTVPDSLSRIARDLKPVYPALSQELSIVVDQAKVGNLFEALQNFSERIDLPQVDSFTSLMSQTERLGTSVSEALTDYSNTMRESLRQRADERANQASFSLLFPTVLCLMQAVFMFLMGPAVIEMTKFSNAGGLQSLNEGRAAARSASNQRPNIPRGTNAGQ